LTRKEVFRYIFWEWIEPIGSALGIALLVMQFVMALYVIPTGSMQPTLHGANDYGTGDKVLVNKFVYRFQEPKRWDVIVFDFPYKSITCGRCGVDANRNYPSEGPEVLPQGLICYSDSCIGKSQDFDFVEKEYIKRCVAVPGDELSVSPYNGDVILKQDDGSWFPSVKTQDAQEALWVPAFDSDEQLASASYMWRGDSVQAWSSKGPHLKAGDQSLLFTEKDVLRGYGDKNGPSSPLGPDMPLPLVGDVALDLEMGSLPSQGVLELDISRNFVPHKLSMDFEKSEYVVSFNGKALSAAKFNRELSQFRFARVDGHLQLQLDGELKRWKIPNYNAFEPTKTLVPKLRYKGPKDFVMNRVRVLRDIFYVLEQNSEFFTGKDRSYKVRSGEYFAMGDNSFYSYDSRNWGPVRQEKLIGKALVVLFPPSRTKFIR
jgi:signal peptidase I